MVCVVARRIYPNVSTLRQITAINITEKWTLSKPFRCTNASHISSVHRVLPFMAKPLNRLFLTFYFSVDSVAVVVVVI